MKFPGLLCLLNSRIVALAALWMVLSVPFKLSAQVTFSFNALADLEFSTAGKESRYFFNEIDNGYAPPRIDSTDFRIGMSHINLISQLKLGSSWSFNVRLWLQRNNGKKFNKFSVPELNLQWLSKKRKWGVTLGSFINPFGSFNEQQLSTQRNFIGLPLAYSYYNNISPKIGFVPGMGDEKIPIDGVVQWGSPHLYYGGYATGAMLSWNINPGKVNWKLALVTGASNQQVNFMTPWLIGDATQEVNRPKPLNWGLTSRIKFQPVYYWEQGVSFSHGTFMKESEVSDQLDNLQRYTQTLIGTDFKLGSGFFEFSGEVIGAFYRVPAFNNMDKDFNNNGEPINLSSLSAYFDVKYELPFLQGSYIAYRSDHLWYDTLGNDHWNDQVWRHSLAAGYHINKYILARVAVSTQQVAPKSFRDTQQGTFRFVLTAHY